MLDWRDIHSFFIEAQCVWQIDYTPNKSAYFISMDDLFFSKKSLAGFFLPLKSADFPLLFPYLKSNFYFSRLFNFT
ncbi:hypothetical protein L6452_05582 [Arctium lappa]|uniref:Uncharacterized protein n=1 Tax=Arctium lappa TaxID=4217 RepID=A0ACB9EH40_ARCLA|nr:hypothetical protein L6452_05582 [Arctium lappa]